MKEMKKSIYPLVRLECEMEESIRRLEKAILSMWPEDTEVAFVLPWNNKNPSYGIVKSCKGSYLSVRMDGFKGNCSVHYQQIEKDERN